MEDRIRAICREIMAKGADEGDVEFVHDVSAQLPSQVIGELMGLPEADWPLIHQLAETNSGGQDPDIARRLRDDDVATTARSTMAMYAHRVRATRGAAEPREDLTTLLLATEFDGATMTDIDFGSFFVQLVTAGNDTTRTMLSSGLLALLAAPRPARGAARRSRRSSRARSRRSCAGRTRCTTSGAPRPPTPARAA